MEIMKISGKTGPGAAAASIGKAFEHGSEVEIQVIGANAVNVAVKAVAIAGTETSLVCVPRFISANVGGTDMSIIGLVVRKVTKKGCKNCG